ncbi:MAG TPA: T9SS type A sorting domain-containing protein [Flavobacteriales bacterium]
MNPLPWLLVPAVLCLPLSGFSQGEHLVTVDPASGIHTIVGGIEGVHWVQTMPATSVFDEVNGRFIFQGTGDGTPSQLYSVDALDGSLIHQPNFPQGTSVGDNIVELQFDNSTGTLYGLHWDASEATEYLVSIDPSTGQHTLISAIPGVTMIAILPNYTTFDENNGLYIFRGVNSSSVAKLYSIDVTTGDIVSSPSFPILADPMDNVVELQFDNASGMLYGLHWDDSEQQEYLVTVDPITGQHALVAPIPNVQWITGSPHYTTFDETNGRFIFMGGGPGIGTRLISVDVSTGDIVSSTTFPVLSNPADNVIELHADNSTGTLYALHWHPSSVGIGHDPTEGVVRVHPNPFDERTTVRLDRVHDRIRLDVFDAQGRMVRSMEERNVQWIDLDRKDLVAGTYHLRLSCDDGNIVRTVVVR